MTASDDRVWRGAFLDLDTVSRNDIDLAPLRDTLDELVTHDATAPGQIDERLADHEVILLNKVRLSRAHLEKAQSLRLVCLAATGFDNVDIEAARELGIAVCNIRGYCTASVAQHVFALILELTVHLAEYRQRLREGAWRQSGQFTMLDFPIRELAGKRLGIVGYGELGRAVAGIGRAFGMQVLIAERPGHPPRDGRLPFAEVAANADVLSLHCPLTDETRRLVDAEVLARMKPDALLINTSRGAVVDETALADAVARGRIGGAGVDVLSEEPPVHGNPLLEVDSPRLVLTPHIAWAAREARQRAIADMADNIRALRAGERLNRVV
ncbi:MAG: 2-hydroxyacid dehydrogenase [Gammaproteobacteria bacterium]|jgi:glycerate dehydrogenase